jgi:hypothetical protein
MAVTAWRVILVTLCLCAAILNAITSLPTAFKHRRRSDFKSADASGLRAGDLINVRDLTPCDRYSDDELEKPSL